MKGRYLILVCFVAASCSRAQWVETTDGLYMYGKLPKNQGVVWTGGSIGPLADGNGDIIVLDDDGAEKSRTTASVIQGAVSDYSYIPIENGSYLGKRKKNIPNGFGSMIRQDTLRLGIFKKGKLYSGEVGIYVFDGKTLIPCYQGAFKKGKPDGIGREFKNGALAYEGSFKKGAKHGIGKEYQGNELVYDGAYSSGQRNGPGKEYYNGALMYDGTWHKGARDGQGTQYNDRGIMVYSGGWKNGLYQGKGKLYENGQCLEGKWDDGRLTKSISTSVFKEISSATKIWLSGKDSLNLSSSTEDLKNKELLSSQVEFIEQLNAEIEAHLAENFEERVEKRFGFWHLPRMIFQPWFKSDIKRANAAQSYFCKKNEAKDIQTLINTKIDYYNENSGGDKLNYIKLEAIPDGAIVDTDAAMKVFEREAMETTDVLVGILTDILICLVIGVIIYFIIWFFIPALIPYILWINLALTAIAFLVGLSLSVFRTTAVSLELEGVIKQMLVDNYMQFLDSQNIILQMFGML